MIPSVDQLRTKKSVTLVVLMVFCWVSIFAKIYFVVSSSGAPRRAMADDPLLEFRRASPIFVGPDQTAHTTFEGVFFQDPDAFWAKFDELNANVLGSDRPLLVYRGSNQGLGNNHVTMLSAAILSVALKRAFRYEWRNGGEVANISTLVDTPFESYEALRAEAQAAGGEIARSFEMKLANINRAKCTLNLGTITSPGCLASLVCSDLESSSVNKYCAHLAVTGNADITPFFEGNPYLRQALTRLFGDSLGLTIARIAPRALRPSLAVRASVARRLAAVQDWSFETTLCVHLRSLRASPQPSISCILRLHAALGTRHVFLATDSVGSREQLAATLGSQLVTFDGELDGDVEDKRVRARSVDKAWEGAVVVSSCRYKALSLNFPGSTFSHLIYHLSRHNDTILDLVTCSEHPPWRHVQEFSDAAKQCGASRDTMDSCIGEFTLPT